MAARRRARNVVQTRAVVLRRVATGDADWILSLLTEAHGRLSASARSARRSQKRFASLEPMHQLHVVLEGEPGSGLWSLKEAKIDRARVRILSSLEAMEAAGQALRWLRVAAPEEQVDEAVWRLASDVLDELDGGAPPRAALATCGLRLLAVLGWALALDRCVRCDKPCPEKASATLDPARGGVVCRSCGGGPISLRAADRQRLIEAVEDRPLEAGDDAVAAVALGLVDGVLASLK